MIRSFIGISLPEEICDYITDMYTDLNGAQWTTRKNLHLTLRFMGEVNNSVHQEIISALNKVNGTSMQLQLSGTGIFPPGSEPKVLWLGIKPNQQLTALREKIDKTLSDIKIEPREKRFIPHITIARLKNINKNELKTFLHLNGSVSSQPFPVNTFHLYSSELLPEGPVYTVEQDYPLK
ncbi:MAG TPA: RNA 2',3'-cyclic phosphodiesterase [Spirochaetota bacterium]|nr:RNA 2',3'-cyclic phosphodiesterase [Spirochaetota bacterium]